MGQRSYLMALQDNAPGTAVLEANNVLPLLWLAMLDRSGLAGSLAPGGPSMRLIEGAVAGVTLDVDHAVARLAARRANVAHWCGEPAGVVLDQLCEFLAGLKAGSLRLDFSEWLDLAESPQEGARRHRGRPADARYGACQATAASGQAGAGMPGACRNATRNHRRSAYCLRAVRLADEAESWSSLPATRAAPRR